MRGNSASASFIRHLRRVLNHLYDPIELRDSPLSELFSVDQREDSVSALRRILIDAIESLKPEGNTPPQSNAWRVYRILFHRYAEQFTQREVATDLALSVRQLRRQEKNAQQALADYLWNQYNLELKVRDHSATLSLTDDDSPTDTGISSWDQEMDWLQKSFPSQLTNIGEVIEAVMEIADPLLKALRVSVDWTVPEDLPPLAMQLITMRQALLNVLTVASRLVSDGRIHIKAEAHRWEARVHIHLVSHHAVPSLLPDGEIEGLAMARDLAELSGGNLEVLPRKGREQSSLIIRLTIPTAEQVSVLVIDDNPDTFQLLQRYVSGTRYRLSQAQCPEQALELAEEITPQMIVLDIMLPGTDGWELLGRFHEHPDPEIRGIPIIICTVLPQEQLALAIGAASFIRKPVSREVFLSTLGRQRLPGR